VVAGWGTSRRLRGGSSEAAGAVGALSDAVSVLWGGYRVAADLPGELAGGEHERRAPRLDVPRRERWR